MFATHNAARMIELLKIHALVRTARVLVFVGAAACRKAEAIAIEATGWCDARDADYRRARQE